MAEVTPYEFNLESFYFLTEEQASSLKLLVDTALKSCKTVEEHNAIVDAAVTVAYGMEHDCDMFRDDDDSDYDWGDDDWDDDWDDYWDDDEDDDKCSNCPYNPDCCERDWEDLEDWPKEDD